MSVYKWIYLCTLWLCNFNSNCSYGVRQLPCVSMLFTYNVASGSCMFFLLTGAILVQYSFMVDINYCVNLQVNLPLYIMAVQL